MATGSPAPLVTALQQFHLLEPEQLAEVARNLQSRFPDPKALAKELIRRGWLTVFQANQVLRGKGRELILGQYVLLDRLGEGAMGQVFKARHRRMGRTVAIKLIHKDRLSPKAVKRFEREVRAAAALSHPNIVLAYDADEVNGTHILVMECIEGGIDLSKLVKENGPLPVATACEYIRQAALGLQHAHEKGMVHRDIKPHNLIVTADGATVKILDMGLARLSPTVSETADLGLTQEGAVLGTADYLAPEQAVSAHTADIRADLYSLGCTFYYLLTGRVPLASDTLTSTLLRHQLDEPVPVEQVRPDVPPAVGAIVRRLMAKKPEDRYQMPGEVAAALASLLSGGSLHSPASVAHQRVAPVGATGLVDSPQSMFDFQGTSGEGTVPTGGKVRQEQERNWHRYWPWAAGLGGVLAVVLIGLVAFHQKPEPGTTTGPGAEKPGTSRVPYLLVSSCNTNSVLRYDGRTGKFIDVFVAPGAEGLDVPVGLAIHRGDLYIGSQDGPVVLRVSLNNRQLVKTFIPPKRGGDVMPYGIAFGPDGKLYVTSRADHSIKRYNGQTGAFIDAAVPSGAGGLKNPMDLAFGPDKKLYVSSSGSKSVLCCDVENGGPVSTYVPAESGGLAMPSALCFGPDGNLYVGGWQDNSVRRYNGRTGSFIDVFVQPNAGGLKEPLGMAFGPDGNLYVGSAETHSVLRYSGKSGAFIDAFVPPGAGGLQRPHCLLFTAEFPVDEPPAAKKPGEVITNSLGMKFAWVPPGTFMMGSPKEEKERVANETQHKVTLTKGFYMGIHLVTQEQWQAVMGNNPSRFKGEKNLPVETVSWDDCQEFIKKLKEKDKKSYRLPTEAEWEYACRAGTTTPFHFGETISTDQANYNGEVVYGNGRKGLWRKKTTPVGSFPANGFGLYDMHGNLHQWCQDWYYGDYANNDAVDPQGYKGPENTARRVIRSASWNNDPGHIRSAMRAWGKPDVRDVMGVAGFRICFSLD